MTSAFELDDVPTAEIKVLAATAAEHAERGRVRARAVDEAEETRTGAVGRSRLSYWYSLICEELICEMAEIALLSAMLNLLLRSRL